MKQVPQTPADAGSLARIIITGRNSEFPKLHKMLAGYGPDGAAIYAATGSPVCTRCEGQGRTYYEGGFAYWQKAGWETCEACGGTGCGPDHDEDAES